MFSVKIKSQKQKEKKELVFHVFVYFHFCSLVSFLFISFHFLFIVLVSFHFLSFLVISFHFFSFLFISCIPSREKTITNPDHLHVDPRLSFADMRCYSGGQYIPRSVGWTPGQFDWRIGGYCSYRQRCRGQRRRRSPNVMQFCTNLGRFWLIFISNAFERWKVKLMPWRTKKMAESSTNQT